MCDDLLRYEWIGGSGNPPFGIHSLEGLQHAQNLQSLALPRNHIADLTPLQGLTKLTELDLSENDISDLTPLRNLQNLRELRLQGNAIEDLSPLAGLSQLEVLYLQDNRIAQLAPLSGLIGLRWLILTKNLIEDVSPLAGLTALRTLVLLDNEAIATYDSLASLTGLRALIIGKVAYVGEENFSPVMREPPPGDTYRFAVPPKQIDMSWLASLRELVSLSIASIDVGDAPFLDSLVELRSLELRNAELTPEALRRIAQLPRLRYLSIDNNRLHALDELATGDLGLERLVAYWNCLDEESPHTIEVIKEVLSAGGTYVIYLQRPAEQCME